MKILISILLLAVFFSMPGASSFADSVTRTAVLSRPVTGTGAGSPTRTGQTISYLPGDDGDLKKGSPVYPATQYTDTPGTTNSVTDNGTGLIWIKDGSKLHETGYNFGASMVWSQALPMIAALNAANSGAGYDGSNQWRLPNIKELMSIVDYGTLGPRAINPCLYYRWTSNADHFWSSTADVTGNKRYCVYFFVGEVWDAPLWYNAYVRPVRDG